MLLMIKYFFGDVEAEVIDIYDSNTLEMLTKFSIHYGYFDIFKTSDKSIIRIVTWTHDGNISILEYNNNNIKRIDFKSDTYIHTLFVLSENKFITTSSSRNNVYYDTIEIYKYDDSKISSKKFYFDNHIKLRRHSISKDGIYFCGSIYINDEKGYIVLFNPDTMKIVKDFQFDHEIFYIISLENNKVICAENYSLIIFNFDIGQEENNLSLESQFENEWAILPDGEIAIIDNSEYHIIIYNPTTTDIKYIQLNDAAYTLCSLPDKRLAVSLIDTIEIYR